MLIADGGSFKDPAGRVYRVSEGADGGRVLRGLNDAHAAIMERLLCEPFFQHNMPAFGCDTHTLIQTFPYDLARRGGCNVQ